MLYPNNLVLEAFWTQPFNTSMLICKGQINMGQCVLNCINQCAGGELCNLGEAISLTCPSLHAMLFLQRSDGEGGLLSVHTAA